MLPRYPSALTLAIWLTLAANVLNYVLQLTEAIL